HLPGAPGEDCPLPPPPPSTLWVGGKGPAAPSVPSGPPASSAAIDKIAGIHCIAAITGESSASTTGAGYLYAPITACCRVTLERAGFDAERAALDVDGATRAQSAAPAARTISALGVEALNVNVSNGQAARARHDNRYAGGIQVHGCTSDRKGAEVRNDVLNAIAFQPRAVGLNNDIGEDDWSSGRPHIVMGVIYDVVH